MSDPVSESAPRALHSISEVSHRLGGISRSTIYVLAKRGDLEIVKIGRRSFVPEQCLRAFVSGLNGK